MPFQLPRPADNQQNLQRLRQQALARVKQEERALAAPTQVTRRWSLQRMALVLAGVTPIAGALLRTHQALAEAPAGTRACAPQYGATPYPAPRPPATPTPPATPPPATPETPRTSARRNSSAGHHHQAQERQKAQKSDPAQNSHPNPSPRRTQLHPLARNEFAVVTGPPKHCHPERRDAQLHRASRSRRICILAGTRPHFSRDPNPQ